MKRHTTVAAFVLALAAYSLGQQSYRGSQDHQDQTATTQPTTKLSKKDRKKLEKEEKKEEKKADEQEQREAKDFRKKQAEEQRKQYKEQEKRAAKERKREQKDEEKHVAAERKRQEKYDLKEAERAEKEEARDMHRHIEREAADQRATASHTPMPRFAYLPRIPVSSTATPGLLLAQRNVGRAIYSQMPSSDVRVLVGAGSQLVLRGSAPSPSWRQRLLQLAMGAASGYSIVDQLASNLVGDAASAVTSGAIGEVSHLIHSSGGKDDGSESSYAPPPDSSPQSPTDSQPALPNSDSEPMVSALDPGSNACVNLSNADQALLTGQVSSQPSAELIRRFARQLASPSALVTDQLAVRTSGVPAAGNAPQDPARSSSEGSITGKGPGENSPTGASPPAAVSAGSTVCVTENNGEVLLTGTVGSTSELGTVENAVQPLVGSGRLLDHLTIPSANSGTQPTASSSANASGPAPQSQQSDVEQALHSIPRLANVNVQLASDGVHLSGSVDTKQDDQMAMDVAREYASGRAVLDNLAITNRTQPPH